SADSLSGGDLYNRKLLDATEARGFPLLSLPWRDGMPPAGKRDLLIWDSLLLDRCTRLANERVALLLHYLPSLDPTLEAAARVALQAVEQRAVAVADFVVATGGPVAEALTAFGSDKPVFVCEPGVEPVFARARASRAPRRGPVKLLTVAHLLPAKGHSWLLAILRELAHLDWRWDVVGDRERSSGTFLHLRDQAALAGLADRIRFHGAIAHEAVAELMADSDLFVFPSSFESYGMVLAEAAATGLPVLSHRVGAAEQLIRNGETGFLVDVGDRDAFRTRLRALLTDAALRAQFGERLRNAPVRGWGETFADFRAACEAMLK
nr:glycosyltransferase [Burkholderiaceae bacterium]